MVSKVLFHPTKPILFVATQRSVRMQHLQRHELIKTLQPSCQYVSCMAIHPKGDNVLVGSFDSRLCWFDLDSSVRPYQTLRHHKKGVRQVAFHKTYPLFASCSDDGSVIISHGMVYKYVTNNFFSVYSTSIVMLMLTAISTSFPSSCRFGSSRDMRITRRAD